MVRFRPAIARSSVFAAILVFVARSSLAGEVYVGFWNVENLFDTQDDPNVVGDEDFTPASGKQWTDQRLKIKLRNLAKVISSMNDGKGPDVLGLCEVENRAAVDGLAAELKPLGRDYQVVHQDSPSDRGIDTALLYDATVFKLGDSKFHFVDADKTRDIIEAKLQQGDRTLYVFVNHWPSRRNPEAQRFEAAKVLRKRIDEIVAVDSKADAVVIGDFNDTPSDVSIKNELKTSGSKDSLPQGYWFNTTAVLQENGTKASYVFNNAWEMLDQVIVSPGMLDGVGFRWKPDSTKFVTNDYQFYDRPDDDRIPSPSRSYSRDDFHEDGYSDHLPVGCLIELAP